MRNETRLAFTAYLNQLAALNGVSPDVVRGEKAFAVEPSIQQKLNNKQQESSAFLQAIKVLLTKRDISAKKKTDEERELAIRQIIGNASGGTQKTTITIEDVRKYQGNGL